MPEIKYLKRMLKKIFIFYINETNWLGQPIRSTIIETELKTRNDLQNMGTYALTFKCI